MTVIIEKVKDEVYNRCLKDTNQYGIGAWTHHILTVYEIACNIYQEYNADYEVVALAALLHDVAAVTDPSYDEEHHIIGAHIAEELLLGYGYDIDKINLIKQCILNHRGSVVKEKISNEEICIADSDALAHFYNISSLLYMQYKEKNRGIDKGAELVLAKLERSYAKLSEIGKKFGENQYEAAKLVLKHSF